MDIGNLKFLIIGQLKTSRTEALEDYLKERVNCLGVIGLMSPFASYNEARCSFYQSANKVEEFPLDSLILKNTSSWRRFLMFIPFFVCIFSVFKAVIKLNKRFDVFIGIATFSAMLGVVLKNMKIVDKVIYYCIDYYPPPKKFGIDSIANFIYKYIDAWLIKKADIIWEISPEIKSGRSRYSKISPDIYKTIIVPLGYSNNIDINLSFDKREANTLGFVGTLSENQGLQMVIKAMPTLINKFPDLKVKVVGSGPYAQELKDLAKTQGVSDHFIFYGFIRDDQQVYDILSHCMLGLATWTAFETDNSLYADPGKPKLYALLGLPIIITSAPYISKVIKQCQAGEVINYDTKEFIKAVEKIISSKDNFFYYQKGLSNFKPYCLAENIFNQAFKAWE